MAEPMCPRCGGQRLTEGRLRRVFSMVFRPRPPRGAREAPDVPVRSSLCLDCGHIDLIGDVEALRARAAG